LNWVNIKESPPPFRKNCPSFAQSLRKLKKIIPKNPKHGEKAVMCLKQLKMDGLSDLYEFLSIWSPISRDNPPFDTTFLKQGKPPFYPFAEK
jgi:hypothetical protein